MVWIINEKETFAVNENPEIQVKQLGENKVIIVDNFYKNPEVVRHLAMNSPASVWKKPIEAMNARHIIEMDLSVLLAGLNKIIAKTFNLISIDEIKFVTNLFIENKVHLDPPHYDKVFFSCFIYLNLPEECNGGTAFYRNRETGMDYYEPKSFENVRIVDDFLFTDEILEKEWELIDYVPMKFNRLILYKGKFFHSAFIKEGWFKNFYRLNQVIFLTKIISDGSIFDVTELLDIKITENSQGELILKLPLNHDFKYHHAIRDFFCLINGKNNIREIFNTISPKYEITDEIRTMIYLMLNIYTSTGELKLFSNNLNY